VKFSKKQRFHEVYGTQVSTERIPTVGPTNRIMAEEQTREMNSTIIRVDALEVGKSSWEDVERKVEEAVADLISKCGSSGKFVDESFGPRNSDKDGASAFYGDGKPPNKNYADPAKCLWVRPRWADDIVTIGDEFGPESGEDSDLETEVSTTLSESKGDSDQEIRGEETERFFCQQGCLFRNGIDANDVIQGRLGDCWLLSGISVLASRGDLLGNVFWRSNDAEMEGKMRKYGFRVCRFFKDNQWFFVIVDDTLPVFEKSFKPVFAHSKDRNELWVSILEKSYAKLHGSYDALIGGYVDGALRDCTGLACEELVLREGHIGFHPRNKLALEEDSLWNKLVQYAHQWGCMMGCSIQPHPKEMRAGQVEQKVGNTGLLMRHAYALIDVGVVRTKNNGRQRLVRLRNPWGFGEWTGPWSDGSDEFRQHKKILDREFGKPVCDRPGIPSTYLPVGDANEGTFFMTWEDWAKYFTVFFAAVDFPDEWSGQRVAGQWTNSTSGGNHTSKTWATNPMHRFRIVEDGTHLYFQLNQEDPRQKGGRNQAKLQEPISFHIIELEGDDHDALPLHPPAKIPGTNGIEIKQPSYKRHLGVDLEVASMKAGNYAVIPSTFAPGKELRYFMQIYANKPIAFEEGVLIAEEEEDTSLSKQIPFDFSNAPKPAPPSGKELAAIKRFEEERTKLRDQVKAKGLTMKSFAEGFEGIDSIDWATWSATLKEYDLVPEKRSFAAFSGEDRLLDTSELARLVEAEEVEREIQGDESFAFIEGDEAVIASSGGRRMQHHPAGFERNHKRLLQGLVDATRDLQEENDDLRAELDNVREEQARMMNVLLLYGKMLKCYDGEVHKPEELIKKPVRKERKTKPSLNSLLQRASAVAAAASATASSSTSTAVAGEGMVKRRVSSLGEAFDSDFLNAGDEFLAVKPWLGAIVEPKNPPKADSIKSKSIEVEWAYGYECNAWNTVWQNAKGSLIYFTAGLGVIFDQEMKTQTYFRGHDNDIVCMDMSADGTKAVTGQIGKSPFACVWDTTTGQLIAKLDEYKHARSVLRVAFSSDGSQVLTIGDDDNHSFALYCAQTGKKLKDLKGQKQKPKFVKHNGDAFVVGGDNFVSFLMPDGTELETKRGIFGNKAGKTPGVIPAATILGNSKVLALGLRKGLICLMGADRKCFEAIQAHNGKNVGALTFVDGKLITGGDDCAVKVWSFDQSSMKLVLEETIEKSHPIRAITREYIGLADGSIVPFKGEEVPIVDGHFRGELWGLAVDSMPGSKFIATVGEDAILKKWDIGIKRQVLETKLDGPSRAVAWSPDGSRIAVGLEDNVVVVFDASNFSILAKSKSVMNANATKKKKSVRKEQISCLAFSPDGSYLAGGSNDSKVYVFDATSLKKRAVFKASTSHVTHLDFSSCSQFLRTNDQSYELLFYNLKTKKQTTSASGLRNVQWATTSCPLSWETQGVWPSGADGTDIDACCATPASSSSGPRMIATADDKGNVTLFPYPFPERNEDEITVAPVAHASHVTNVAFLSGSQLLSTGGNDRTLIQWKLT